MSRSNLKKAVRRVLVISVVPLVVFSSRLLADTSETLGNHLGNHIDQATIADLPFLTIFKAGDRLFNTDFTSADGAGANLALDNAISIRFSRVPRADLPGFRADPFRTTGPNAQSCKACHNHPFEASSGGLEATGIRDSRRSGIPAEFILRNPIHLFGSGALQRLAEEATADIKQILAEALARARSSSTDVTAQLVTDNGVSYGLIKASPSGVVDTSQVRGVDLDFVVKPYFWKGELASFLRALVSGSAALELGMQGEELVGQNDFDADGIARELSIGDITAMTMYVAAQPRPVTRLELSLELGGEFTLKSEEVASIQNGEERFQQIGCTECHRPTMILKDSMFQEPSRSADYRDPRFNTIRPVKFDLATNPTVSRKCGKLGEKFGFGVNWDRKNCFPQFESNGQGGTIVRLYGDLKRHDMGPALADAVDEIGTGRSMWKTRELWGVGNTGPWLHDGRATTLSEAILLHGGESQPSRDRFSMLNAKDQEDVVNFMKNLVLFKPRH
jgi:hypothetical protein